MKKKRRLQCAKKLKYIRSGSSSALKSKWHGKVIPLVKPKTQKEYEQSIYWLGNHDIHHIINLGCMWENIPRTLTFR